MKEKRGGGRGGVQLHDDFFVVVNGPNHSEPVCLPTRARGGGGGLMSQDQKRISGWTPPRHLEQRRENEDNHNNPTSIGIAARGTLTPSGAALAVVSDGGSTFGLLKRSSCHQYITYVALVCQGRG